MNLQLRFELETTRRSVGKIVEKRVTAIALGDVGGASDPPHA